MTSPGSPRDSSEAPFWVSFGLGFAVVALILVALAYIVSKALNFLIAAPTDLGSAVVGAGALVFVAVIANIWAKIYERRQQIQQEQRTKKTEVYEGILAFWFGFYLRDEELPADAGTEGNGSGKSTKDEDINKYMNEFTHKMVTWGSDSVIHKYVAFKDKIKGGGALIEFEDLIFAIRKDLGYKNKGLKPGDILKVFINSADVDEQMK